MKTLLWVSRHEPVEAQILHIVKKIGEVEIIKITNPVKEEIKKEINSIKSDCIVGIVPRTWIWYLLENVPKTVIWLKPKYKAVHPGKLENEPCSDYDCKRDVIINPTEKRYDNYFTKGDNILHLRHSGYERVLRTRDQLLFINWKV